MWLKPGHVHGVSGFQLKKLQVKVFLFFWMGGVGWCKVDTELNIFVR